MITANHVLATLLILSTFLGGCKSNSSEDSTSIIIALPQSPVTLDPRFTTDAYGTRITNLIFSSLVRFSHDLKIVGDAAATWSYQPLKFTFKLYPDISFSDGTPLSKEDLLFTFAEYQSESNPKHTSLKSIKKVEVTELVENGKTLLQLSLSLNEYSADLLNSLTEVKILSKKWLTQKTDEFQTKLIGTGNFILKEQNSSEIRLRAAENHWRQTPKIKNVIFKFIRDSNTLFLKTVKGDIDISQSALPLNKIKDLEKEKHLRVVKYPGLNMSYLLLNHRQPIFKKKEVRRALAMGIDRENIIRYKLNGLAKPATTIITPANPFFDSTLPVLKYNPEEAKHLFETNNVVGKTIQFKTSNNREVTEIAQVLVYQLEALGLKIKWQNFEWGSFYQDIQNGIFEMASMQWVGIVDPDIYRISLHSQQTPPGRNRGFYNNPKLDEMTDLGLKLADIDARKKLYSKVQNLVLDDLPIIPLWYMDQVAVVHERIKNYQPPVNGDYSFLSTVTKEQL